MAEYYKKLDMTEEEITKNLDKAKHKVEFVSLIDHKINRGIFFIKDESVLLYKDGEVKQTFIELMRQHIGSDSRLDIAISQSQPQAQRVYEPSMETPVTIIANSQLGVAETVYVLEKTLKESGNTLNTKYKYENPAYAKIQEDYQEDIETKYANLPEEGITACSP